MASNEPVCSFEIGARERLVALEIKSEHAAQTQDAMLEELKAIRVEINGLTRTLIEQTTKANTAASVGWSALSLWTKALSLILGGIGTLFGAAWVVGKALGLRVILP